jgi:hypothetical protein
MPPNGSQRLVHSMQAEASIRIRLLVRHVSLSCGAHKTMSVVPASALPTI